MNTQSSEDDVSSSTHGWSVGDRVRNPFGTGVITALYAAQDGGLLAQIEYDEGQSAFDEGDLGDYDDPVTWSGPVADLRPVEEAG